MFNFDKSVLVLDSCALIFLSNVFIRGKSLLDFLIYDLKTDIYIAPAVHEEVRRLLSSQTATYIEQTDEILKREIYLRRTIKIGSPSDYCPSRIKGQAIEITKEGKLSKSWLDRGERDSAALALYFSKKYNVFFITGDFKAIKLLKEIFHREFIGVIYSPHDLCVYLYSKGMLRHEQAEKLLFDIEEIISDFRTSEILPSRIEEYREKLKQVCNFSCKKPECLS